MIKDDFFIEETTTSAPDYETERNKPIPNRIHGRIQGNLTFELRLGYPIQNSIESEVSLDTKTMASTP